MQQLNLLPSQPHKPLELRDYQRQMKRDIYAHIKAGTNRILVYGPTGSGKTLVLSSVLQDALSKGRRCLLLVHRDFLVEQTMATLLNLGVENDRIGIIKAGYPEDRARPLQIAGLQSLNNRAIPEDIGLVVADECHSVAFWGGYQRVKDAAPDAIQLGFTASPWRLKPHIEYFGQHYDAIVRGPSIKKLIEDGHLSRLRCYGWGGIVNYNKIDQAESGDFNPGQMEAEFIEAKIPEFAVTKIRELADGRTGIIFNAGCKQSQIQSDLLNKAGILTAHVDAATPAGERRRIYAQLEAGQLQCISSVGCLTEGFDVKSIGFVVLARATKSRALYVQMCGRGTRTSLEKENCLVLDFGSNVKRLGHLTTDWHIGLEKEDPQKNKGQGDGNGEQWKECLHCGSLCHVFVRICPECGHVFPRKKTSLGNVFAKRFGELPDPETIEMVKYVRLQRRMRFNKNQPPDRLWPLFKEKYGQATILVNEWLDSAVFGEQLIKGNQQRFLDYLDGWKLPNNKRVEKWVQHHLKLEFPQCNYEINHLNHWEVLKLEKECNLLEIRATYQNLVKSTKDNAEEIDFLNWAFEKAESEKFKMHQTIGR